MDTWNTLEVTKVATIAVSSAMRAKAEIDRLQLLNQRTLAWIYMTHPKFFREFWGRYLETNELYAIVDYRQRANFAELQAAYKTLHARSWSRNRTMHDKTFLFPTTASVILTTANWTKGSWTLSENSCAIVTSEEYCAHIEKHFIEQFRRATPIPPLKPV